MRERHLRTAATKTGVTVDEYLRLTNAGLKFCWHCRRWQASAMFGRDRSRADGLAAVCTQCRRPPRQLPLLTRTQAEYERQRYHSDAVYRFERRQHAHARKRGVDPMPIVGVVALHDKFGGLCAYCPASATTWDRLVPVSKGGRTIPGNIVPACMSCNSRKGNRDLRDFIETFGVVITTALEAEIALAYEIGDLQ